MKDNKKFFENNRLNKGYTKIYDGKKSDINIIKERFKHILPPIDTIEQYEDLNPGTFSRLLDMAQSEQNHRHTVDLLNLDKYNKAIKYGRICGLIFAFLICLTIIIISFFGNIINAITFGVLAFLSTFGFIGFLYSKLKSPKNFRRNENHFNKKQSKYRNKVNSY